MPTTYVDDYADNTGTTGVLAIGGEVTGSIELPNDEDWFKVTLEAGTTYIFDALGANGGGGTLGAVGNGVYLVVRNSYGFVIDFATDNGSGGDPSMSYKPYVSGTYYLSVSDSLKGTGTYTLKASTSGTTDDYASNTGTTGVLAIGGEVTGSIELPNDEDWFKVTLEAGTTYIFDALGANGGGGTLGAVGDGVYLVVRNSYGFVIDFATDNGVGGDPSMSYKPYVSGTYYLSVSDSLKGTGTYTLKASTSSTTDDYAGNTGTTGVLAIGGEVTGSIELPNDEDWFKVNLEAGTTYIFDALGVSGGGGTLGAVGDGVYLVVRNSYGGVIDFATDNGIGGDPSMSYKPYVSGTYYLSISDSLKGTGTYTLKASVAGTNSIPIIKDLPVNFQDITLGIPAALVDFSIANTNSTNITVTLNGKNGTIGGLMDSDPINPGIQITGTADSINAAISGATFTGNSVGTASISISVAHGIGATPITGTYNFNIASSSVTSPGTSVVSSHDFVVLQPSSTAIAGAGAGNDTYLLSGSMLPAGKAITLSDTSGTNTLQLAPGLSIAASQLSATALKLTLANGASLTVLGADKFNYDVGGNLSAGLNQPDLSYSQFVQNILGTTVPTSGLASGAALVVGDGTVATVLASVGVGNDFIAAQTASPSIIGGGAGNDTYLISQDLLATGKQISISDAQGLNSIQLASGLQIASAQVAATALKLNLTNGASITVLGADKFTFEAGGNTTAGIDLPDLSYSQFIQSALGGSVPLVGVVTTTEIVI